jgi:predicted deacetylase
LASALIEDFVTTYLLRFDDLCPTMDWHRWDQIEELMDKYCVKPIACIVPDNRDPKLNVCPGRKEDFWNRAQEWQKENWIVGLHGYQHIYDSKSPGLIPLHEFSEFSGHSYEVQKEKLEKGLAIFESHGIRPDSFVAPGHSFDLNTLKALKEIGLPLISDGLYFRPVIDQLGVKWIPQQFWRPRRMPFWCWTICYHPNSMQNSDFFLLETFLKQTQNDLVSDLQNILKEAKPINVIDKIWSQIFLAMLKFRQKLKK